MLKKVIIIPDSFKGSLSSSTVSGILNDVILQKEGHETLCVPMADGGEGSTDCIIKAMGGSKETAQVHSPENKIITATYGITLNRTAVMEIAESSGITKVEHKNALTATTYGFGEMIKAGLDNDIREFLLCLGGSATTDCGCGMAAALGIKFIDANGNCFVPTGGTLKDVAEIDASGVDKRIWQSRFTVMSDVENPLFGPLGAAYIYGPQKGASPEEVELLDAGLMHISNVMRRAGFKDPCSIKGAGAAGGTAYGCAAFLNATVESGIDAMLDICHFEEAIENAAYIVTGEGKLDEQSFMGKVVGGIRRRSMGKPMYVFCGISELSPDRLETLGITVIEISKGTTPEDSMANGEKYLREAATEFMKLHPEL
ncbi:MAG: glycerate kinase [Lachnospiraceae bacterium]|nr:glycerate kinase [Lachnospiraceae bacterium]